MKMQLGVIILAGGQGNRIGKNKAFINLSDSPLINHIHSIAQELSDEIIIVTRKEDVDKDIFVQLPGSPKIVPDLYDNIGPLMGLYSGLRVSKAKKCLILPCDTPLAKIELLKFIVKSSKGYEAVIPQWPNGFIEPLHGVYDVNKSIPFIESSLNRGEKRIKDLIKQFELINYISIDSLKKYDPDLVTFININYLNDLQRVKHILEQNSE